VPVFCILLIYRLQVLFKESLEFLTGQHRINNIHYGTFVFIVQLSNKPHLFGSGFIFYGNGFWGGFAVIS